MITRPAGLAIPRPQREDQRFTGTMPFSKKVISSAARSAKQIKLILARGFAAKIADFDPILEACILPHMS